MAPKKCRSSSRNSRKATRVTLGAQPLIGEADGLFIHVVHDLTDQGYTNRLQLEVKLDELPE